MKKEYEILFTPFKIGNVEIKNRFVLAPMGQTSLLDTFGDSGFKDGIEDFFIDRAKDGVGLLIPGVTFVYSVASHEPVWKHPEYFEKMKNVTDAVHAYGSKMFIQLSAGFGKAFPMSKQMYENFDMLSEKAHFDLTTAAAGDGFPNRWMNEFKTKKLPVEAIHEMVEGFAETAYLCKQNGADGVEVHAVHEGYLLDQFTISYSNNRDDEYGGSLENRLRFPCEIVKAIKAKCGDDFPVAVRYSVTSKVKDFNKGILPQDHESKEIGRSLEESQEVIRILSEAGYDFFDADNGNYDAWYYAHPPVYMPLNCNLPECEAVKPYTDKPIACAGRMQLDAAAEAIRAGKIDSIAIGRQLLADEQYLTKIKEDRLDEVRPCIACHLGCLAMGTWKGAGAQFTGLNSCALNPYALNERKYAATPSANPKKFAVIGAGIAGLEFALQAKKRGHDVTVYEKSDRIAGVFNEAAVFSFKEKDRELIEYYKKQAELANLDIRFNTEITDLDALDADEIVLATGAAGAKTLPIPGFENAIPAIDFLKNGLECGDKVAVIGGGLTGCEIAYELAKAGKHPVIIEVLDDILEVPGSSMANTSFLRDAFEFYKVPVYTSAKTLKIEKNAVEIETETGEKVTLPVDQTVVSIGYKNGVPFDLEGRTNVHVIGDADKVSTLLNAVGEANDLVITW